MSETTWKLLIRLPIELFGAAILVMLELQDCVRLDSAADKQGRPPLEKALSYYRTSKPIEVKPSDSAKLEWFLHRSMNNLCLTCTQAFNYREFFKKYGEVIASVCAQCEDQPSNLAELSVEHQIATRMKKIVLSEVIDADCLKDVPRLLQNVEHLDWCHSQEAESWCAQLLANNPRMRTLHMYGINQPLSAELAVAIVQTEKLEELILHFSYASAEDDVAGASLRSLSTAAASHTARRLPLKKLTIQAYSENTLNVALVPLLQCCPLLQELTLYGVHLLEADAVALIQVCRCLQSLSHIDFVVTNVVLEALVEVNPPLHSLDLCWTVTSMDAVQRAAQLLSRLLTVDFSLNTDEAEEERNLVTTLSAALKLMTNLRDLTLSGTAECLAAVARREAGTLTRLVLDKVTVGESSESDADDSLCLIAQRNPHLVELTVFCQVGLSDSLLKALAAHCPRLEVLRLSEPDTVSDTGIVALAEGCAQLKSVLLFGVKHISDVSVLALAKGCPRLTCFSCMRATSSTVTEGTLVQLFHRCRQLRTLQVSSQCMSVETAAILEMQRSRVRVSCSGK